MTTIDWDLLLSYLAGTGSPTERARFEQLLADDPRYAATLAQARRLGTDADREVRVERIERGFAAAVASAARTESGRARGWHGQRTALAAAVVLAAGIGI